MPTVPDLINLFVNHDELLSTIKAVMNSYMYLIHPYELQLYKTDWTIVEMQKDQDVWSVTTRAVPYIFYLPATC